MPEAEQNTSGYCERCHRESRHVVKSIGLDKLPHYVCWSCLYREEKRFNLKKLAARTAHLPAGSLIGYPAERGSRRVSSVRFRFTARPSALDCGSPQRDVHFAFGQDDS